MNRLFFKNAGQYHSYEKLLKAVNQKSQLRPDYQSTDLWGFYLHLILALTAEEEITITDFNYPELRIASTPVKSAKTKASYESIEELVARVSRSQSRIHLYTSGSSGQAKKVSHPVQRLFSMSRVGPKYRKDTWALAYNAAHMAGLQVFLQAFLNQNPIINVFGYSPVDIFREIRTEKISHFSATPTFYRMLLSAQKICPTIQRLTIGGERSDKHLYEQLQPVFPNARVNNIYATTESGTLLVSKGEFFQIPEHLKSKIKIVANELWIHHTLLGQTDEKEKTSLWHPTGDRICWADKHSFRFTGRKTAIVNVAGYQVDLEEVTEKIRTLEGVRNCRVFARANSLTGNIICCDLEAAGTLKEAIQVKKALADGLPAYKIPRIIRFVDQIIPNQRGKISAL